MAKHHGRWTEAYSVLASMIARGVIEETDGGFRITTNGRAIAARYRVQDARASA